MLTIKTKRNLWPIGWRDRTCVMGVLNVTPDSFSDGGRYLDPALAEKQALKLIKQGADVLDIGAQSTRPMSPDVGSEEEIRRLKPVLALIRRTNPDVLISVDTYHSDVAEMSLNMGADWINDVTGGRNDPNILKLSAETKCPYILTHSRGNSITMDNLTNYNDVVKDVYQGLLRRTEIALNSGIKPHQIIWDPGLGFAKTNEQNIDIIRHIELICSEKFPVLVGPSRKRFIGDLLNQPNPELRIWGTVAIACRCQLAKVAMIRVHDVDAIYQTLSMARAIF